jgi:4-diphosphocytidyl-2-C-methyl-D-erythritol kinase
MTTFFYYFSTMIVFPNAKINIGLHIINKRSDGYHNIETCFYPIAWKDILEIIPANELSFSTSGISIPGDPKDNLCIRAYKILKEVYDLPPVKIHLHKIVPMGAGLGGGSSDAAFTISLLNEKFGLGISEEQKTNYASKLGSDCAFFIKNEPIFATQKGDVWEEVKPISLNSYHLVVIYPQIHVSTALAYQSVVKRGESQNLKEKLNLPIERWKSAIDNDFEKSVFPAFPALISLKALMYKENAIYASMSGSGSAIYGIFEKEPDVDKFKMHNYLVWSAKL